MGHVDIPLHNFLLLVLIYGADNILEVLLTRPQPLQIGSIILLNTARLIQALNQITGILNFIQAPIDTAISFTQLIILIQNLNQRFKKFRFLLILSLRRNSTGR